MADGSGYLARPAPSGLADVIEIILDKGIVIDAYARVSLIGVELLTVDARVAIASVDTYLRFAEATNRLDLYDKGGKNPMDLISEGVGKAVKGVATKVVEKKVEGVLDSVEEKVEKVTETVQGLAQGVVEKAGDLVEKMLPNHDDSSGGSADST